MPDGLLLTILAALPFLGMFAAPFLPQQHARNAAAALAGLVALIGLAIVIWLFPEIAAGGALRHEIAWLGLNLVFRLNGLSWLFAVMITGIGFLVVLYARYYMQPDEPVARFFALFLGFMGSMLGIVLSGNLVQLVLFWELTSVFSFLLIGYWHASSNARDGARMALIITGTGGLALFVGILVIGHIVGSFDVDIVLGSGELIRNHPLYLTALLLVLVGAFTKSAQFPFQFWLPMR